MPKVNEAAVNCTGVVRRGALIVSVLSTEAPAARLPEGTVFDNMAGSVVIALETVRELELSSLTPFTKHGVSFKTVFSFFDIRWALGSEDTWDPIITGGKKEGGGGRRTRGKEMLLEASANRTRSETSLHCE